MEARIARLESDVGHLRSDVTEVKVDLRSLRDRMDARFEATDTKIDNLAGAVSSYRAWTLTILLSFAVLVFGTMARGFGWV